VNGIPLAEFVESEPQYRDARLLFLGQMARDYGARGCWIEHVATGPVVGDARGLDALTRDAHCPDCPGKYVALIHDDGAMDLFQLHDEGCPNARGVAGADHR